ncbi:MAG: DUF4926 domain-containing protein [Cyanobacteria bacterium P01_A01_bin.40]
MVLELYSEVALTQNIADRNLKIGDVATLVDFVPHSQGGEEGCVLEIFNAVGELIAVVTVPISAIKSLSASEILTTRPLKQAS